MRRLIARVRKRGDVREPLRLDLPGGRCDSRGASGRVYSETPKSTPILGRIAWGVKRSGLEIGLSPGTPKARAPLARCRAKA